MKIGTLSTTWLQVFPPQLLAELLDYVVQTWVWLRTTYPNTHVFETEEPDLTESLCTALDEDLRKRASAITSQFEAEVWQRVRLSDGSVKRVSRTDITVTYGAPGTPRLIMEFKKLNGTTDHRWRYCFDGIQRFVDGKYANQHLHGVMCGFVAHGKISELTKLVNYIDEPGRASKLICKPNKNGKAVTRPSDCAPNVADFDTHHDRPTIINASPILLAHVLLECPLQSAGTLEPV